MSKQEKAVKYVVTARQLGTKQRYTLTYPCPLDYITRALGRLESDPFYTNRFVNFRINRHNSKLPVWYPRPEWQEDPTPILLDCDHGEEK